MNKLLLTLCGLILSSAILWAGGPCGTLAVDSIRVTDASCNGASDGEIVVYTSGGTGPITYSNGQGSTGAAINILQPFNSDVIVNSGSPTLSYYSPGTCNGGSFFDYSPTGGCSGGSAYYEGPFSGFAGCFLRTPQANATGLSAVTMSFDITHPLGNTNDSIRFYIWIGGGYKNQSIVPVSVNGTLGRGLRFNQARTCERIEVVFDLSSPLLMDRSGMYLYIETNCGSSSCSGYYAYIDNIEVLEGGGSSYQSTNTFTGLPAGNYDITVQDGNGCVLTYPLNPVIVGEPAALSTAMSSLGISAYGANDGKAWVTVGGGTAPYTYTWSGGTPGVSNDTIVNLAAGSYTVTIIDANGCTATDNITLTSPPCNLNVTAVTANAVSCNGGNDGNISITASGGAGTLQYSINNGSTYQLGSSFGGLSPGLYNVRVLDANGCSVAYGSNPVSVTEPTAINIVMNGTSPTTIGGTDGRVWATVSGGTPSTAGPAGYVYNWSAGVPVAPFGDTLVSLTAGNYCVTVTDANGCTASDCYTVTQPSCNLSVSATPSNPSCNGSSDGSIIITASQGSAPYEYSINNGATYQNDDTYSGLAAGSYTVIARDINGCADTVTVLLSDPQTVAITASSITPVSVAGGSDGAVNITIGGGTGPYNYSWSNGATTEDISGISSGNYCVTVTDNNGCTLTDCYAVNQPGCNLFLSTTLLNPGCNGAADGRITITVSQGAPPIQYSIDGGNTFQSGNSFASVPAGTYSIVVIDGNSCTETTTVQLTNPPLLTLNGTATAVTTTGAADGSIDIAVSGGTPGYSFLWSNSATTENLTGLATGNYCVTVTDGNGCSASDCFTVSSPTNPCGSFSITNVQVTQPLCYGDGGRININISGGQNPVLFSIDSGTTFQNGISLFTGLPAGAYQVLVRDNANCQVVYGSNPVTIVSVAPLNPVITWVPGTGFFVNDDFNAYQWLFNGSPLGAANDTSLVENGAGTYAVEVTDANGCKDTSNVITVTGLDSYHFLTKVELYPNPAQDEIMISASQIQPLEVTIVNLQGKTLAKSSLPHGNGHLDVAHLAPGMYLVQLQVADQIQVRKLIVE